MGIARITVGPSKSKEGAYLNHDISNKLKKKNKYIKILIGALLISIGFNIYQFVK